MQGFSFPEKTILVISGFAFWPLSSLKKKKQKMLVVGTPGFQDGVQIPAASLLAVVPVLVMGVGLEWELRKMQLTRRLEGMRFSVNWFTPHVATKARAGPGWNRELHPGFPHAWATFCFPKCLCGRPDGKCSSQGWNGTLMLQAVARPTAPQCWPQLYLSEGESGLLFAIARSGPDLDQEPGAPSWFPTWVAGAQELT